MGWHIEVMENQLGLSMAQAAQLVDLLEGTWDEYSEYLGWFGDKAALAEFFGGERLEFIDDFMEHMDYLQNAQMQAALVAVGARGFVTIGDFDGDNRGHAWTHDFTDAGYAYGFGKVRLLANGKMPVKAAQVPQIDPATVQALTPRAPFDGNGFVITGNFATLSREAIAQAISSMGGTVHGSVSSKTISLVAGSEPGPAKLDKAQERGIAVWDEETFLVHAGLKMGTAPSVAPIAAGQGTEFNTLSYKELHAAFERVVLRYDGGVYHGLTSKGPKLEDGLPWFEVEFAGKRSTRLAKEFAQELAREMNVRVLFNRIEGETGSWSVLGCFDFDPDCLKTAQVPAYSRTEDAAEFMEDYGTPFLPNAPVKKAKATKAKPERVPYGWHYEEYHVESGEVVRDGFSRVDVTGMVSKIKGFAFRFTALFAD